MLNAPDLWIKSFPFPSNDGHKYDRGGAVIFGAPKLTGATRLAASACSRLCGATIVVALDGAGDIYRVTLPAHIMVKDADQQDLLKNAQDERTKSVLLGSGGGYQDEIFRNLALGISKMRHINGMVLDAEAIKAWHKDKDLFAQNLAGRTIITPHEGEFSALFQNEPEFLSGSRESRALNAAAKLKTVLVLKGAQTIITDGKQLVLNDCAPPDLATAGSGDVLAGLITGLVAGGMPLFAAACAGVWLHSQAALKVGVGLVASDLFDQIPYLLKDLLGIH